LRLRVRNQGVLGVHCVANAIAAPGFMLGLLTMWVSIGESANPFQARSMVEPTDNLSRPLPLIPGERSRVSDPSDRALDEAMDRYARGDDAAFDGLYRRGAPRLRGFLLRLCGDRALAEDLIQEAFLRVHRARGSFGAGAPAVPWILAIGRNVFRDHVRRVRARPATTAGSASEDEHAQPEAAVDTRGDEALAAQEMLDVVRRTLSELPTLQREAFLLLRFEGLSVSEAAQVVGASVGAVKIRAFRAYEALRAALDHAAGAGR
jgi:RNA polymerase sigma-70 factor, ECF subfamily